MIYTINALCGAGKTHWAIGEAKKLLANNKNVLYVCPSLELQAEVGKRFGNTKHTIVNYKSSGTAGVVGTINEYLKNPARGEALIITHAAFKSITRFPKKHKWTVYFDEECDVFDFMTLNSDDSSEYAFGNDLVGDMGKIGTFQINEEFGYSTYKIKNMNKKDLSYIKGLCYGKDNGVYPPFKRLIQALINPNVQIYCDTESMVFFKFSGLEIEIWTELNTSIFEGFENLYFMGAEIQRSKLCAYLKLKNVIMKELVIPKRFETHEQEINIKYMTTHSPWSKNYYNTANTISPDVTNFELYDSLVGSSIGNTPILTQSNIGMPFKHISNKIDLPYEIRGMNQFSKYDHYTTCGAFNMPPSCALKMEHLGFDVDELQLQHALNLSYQGLMRGSLREGKFNNNTVYLPTEQLALLMRNIYFPNAKVSRIEGSEYFF